MAAVGMIRCCVFLVYHSPFCSFQSALQSRGWMSEKSMSRLTKALALLTKMTSFNKTHNRLNFKVLFILKKCL